VIKGAVIDYAVDIRKGSPTFGKLVSAKLSAENRNLLWVPPGFAHGFLSLEEGTEFLYKTTNEWSPEHERGINVKDPELGINFPIKEVIMDQKDKNWPLLKKADINYEY
jgi:dTDP-4-dehydrorhamnose 3,5-epimerase